MLQLVKFVFRQFLLLRISIICLVNKDYQIHKQIEQGNRKAAVTAASNQVYMDRADAF